MGAKVAKLNIEGTDTGINIDVDGASEGIHIEYEILANVMAVIVQEALDATKHDQGNLPLDRVSETVVFGWRAAVEAFTKRPVIALR